MLKFVVRYLFCLAFAFLLSLPGYSQTNWLRRDGGSSNEEALDLAHDFNENVYYCGYFNNSLIIQSQLLSNAGFSDIYIAKRTPVGSDSWVAQAGGAFPDRAFACATDNNSNVLVTGYFTSSANFGSVSLSANNSSQDAFVAKYSTNGTLQWAVPLGGDDADAGYGIDTDPSGNIYVTGAFKGLGVFGGFNVVSSLDESGVAFSSDIFVCKLDPNGNVLWVKTGLSTGEDLATDITCASDGSAYITGYFSNDIQFDVVYPNSVDNSGFVLKVDANGNDLWFQTVYSNYIYCRELEALSDGVALSGNYSGQMTLGFDAAFSVNSSFDYNNFILKLDQNGNSVWISDEGSDNPVVANAIDINDQGDLFQTGFFECDFTELNTELGGRLFYSAGEKDVFIVKYSATGSRIWQKHYGGPGDDQSLGIAVKTADQAFIAGAFESWLNIPVEDGMTLSGCVNTGQYSPNSGLNLCGYTNYGSYQGLEAIGGRDIFVSAPVNMNAPPYDFASHENSVSCLDPIQPFCFEFCADTISDCVIPGELSYMQVSALPSSDPEQIIGPSYSAIWSSGIDCQSSDVNPADLFSMCVQETGWIWMTISRSDGCGVPETDSLFVQFLDTPAIPIISDELGYIEASQNPEDFVLLCQDQDVFFIEMEEPSVEYVWSGDGVVNALNQLEVDSSGTAVLTATALNGCYSAHEINFDLSNDPPYLDHPGHLEITLNGVVVTADSIQLCPEDAIVIEYIFDDSNDSNQDDVFGYWYTDLEIGNTHIISDTSTSSGNHTLNVYATMDGYLTIYQWLNYQWNSCDYVMDSISLYVDVQNQADVELDLMGPAAICPGDTISLTANATPGMSVIFTGPQILGATDDLTFETTLSGMYTAVGTITTSLGCIIQMFDQRFVQATNPPLIFSNPNDGIICPDQSATLTAQNGLAYTWIGPAGNIVGTTQSIQVSEAGYYYCLQTNFNGCELESDFIEITEYTTPYITASPYNYFCDVDEITLLLDVSEAAVYHWINPDAGVQLNVVVTDPGIYSAEVTACGSTDTVSLEIFASPINSSYIVHEPNFFCEGDTIVLSPADTSLICTWLPSGLVTNELFITAPGVYQAQFVDTNGCVGIGEEFTVAYDILENPAAQSVSICAGTSVILNVQTDFDVFWLNALGDTVGFASTYETPILSEPQTFSIQTHVDECSSEWASVQVNFYPEVNFEINPEENCPNQNISYNVIDGSVVSPIWSFGDDAISNQSSPNHAYSAEGVYNVTLTGITTEGCEVAVSQPVTIHPAPVSIFETDMNQTCSGSFITLTDHSIGAVSYVWSLDGSNFSSDMNTMCELLNETCDIQESEITELVISQYNCRDTSAVQVTVWPRAQALFDLTDPGSCFGDFEVNVVNESSCADTYNWTVNSTSQSNLFEPVLLANNIGNNEVKLFVDNTWHCSDSLTKNFELYPLPEVQLIADDLQGCGELLTSFHFTPNNILECYWEFSDGQTSVEFSPEILFSTAGIFDATLVVTDVNGCQDSLYSENLIQVYPIPFAEFEFATLSDDPFDLNYIFEAAYDPSIVYWHWDFGDSGQGVGQTVEHEYLAPVDVEVELFVMNENGCSASVIHPIYFENELVIYIPNAFTPDITNQLNDNFGPIFSDVSLVKQYHFTIYNRWGEIIFETEDPDDRWVGNVKEGDYFCPDGVYLWTLEFGESNTADRKEMSGHVTMVR